MSPAAKFEMEEIERALVAWAKGDPAQHHTLSYAWRALKLAGYRPNPANDELIKRAVDELAAPPAKD